MKRSKAYKRRKYDRYYRATALYKKRRWTGRDEVVLANWTGTDRELSSIIKRSIASIQHKRSRMRRDGVKIARYENE